MENTVNERIKILRNKLDISQQDFATAIKTTTTTMSRIEAGQTTPRKSTIDAIVKKFSVSRDWLVEGIGEISFQTVTEQTNDNPWKDALVSELKEEVRYLRELLKMAMSSKQTANFNNGIALAGLFENKKFSNTVRA
jgi:transcriptional regulator with XRE-family HTH domain